MRHTVSPDTFLLIIFNSFFRYSFSKGICHLSCTCTDGQLLEGEQIPLCPKFSKFIGREENFWEGELSNQAKLSYLSINNFSRS